jgi:NADPH:quinone reductase-like Zn-dependent oxidoreductase
MQAIRFHHYGGPEALALEDVEAPVPGDDQVLVRVRAASVNALDWHAVRGLPYLVRAVDGLRRPKDGGLGCDVAGVVEAVGATVTRFRPGDEVFGMTIRAFSERVSVREAGLVHKPADLSFEQAAAIPVAGTTALQGLRDKGRIHEGSRVLVNGAGGGVGTFAVQIAKAFGAQVTAVTGPDTVELARSIGADDVIDYTKTDFTRQGKRYDLIFDAGGNRSFRDCARVMAPDGVLVICGAPKGNWLAPILRPAVGALRSRLESRTFAPFLSHRVTDDLQTLRELAAAGTLRPAIERTYSLAEVPEAIRRIETGRVRGKLVVTVSA